jgi:autotransporter-associated beta strand protein
MSALVTLLVSALFITGVIPTRASAQSGSWSQNVFSAGGYNWSDTGNWTSATVADGANNTATFATASLTGNMIVNLDTIRTIGALVFDNPTNLDTWTVQGANTLTLTNSAAGGPTIAVSDSGNIITATISSPVASVAGFTKTGLGTLVLGGVNSGLTGGITISGGTLSVASDANLGSGPITINALGKLNYTATGSTTKSFAINGGTLSASAGAKVTLNGGTFTGGTLGGSGVFLTDSVAGARFGGMNTAQSVTLYSNSSADQFINVNNSGTLNIGVADANNSAGNINITTPVTLNGFTNQGNGTVTVGAGVSVNAIDFQSYGLMNITPASGTGKTLVTNAGTSQIFFNGGSRTFLGTIGSNPARSGLELNGQNAVVAGGLFVNNGSVTDSSAAGISTIIADYGALVKGAGTYDNSPITRNGGRFQSGNSPGLATFNGRFGFGGNTPAGIIPVVSNYLWQINNATGTAGPTTTPTVSGWSLANVQFRNGVAGVQGDFYWDASPTNQVLVSMQTLHNPTTPGSDVAGAMANFDPAQKYTWSMVTFAGSYLTQDTTDYPSGAPTSALALNAATTFDFSGFSNLSPAQIAALNTPGNPSLGWQITVNSPAGTGGELDLVYQPVPEPGTLALTGLASLGFGWMARRRRIGSAVAKTAE